MFQMATCADSDLTLSLSCRSIVVAHSFVVLLMVLVLLLLGILLKMSFKGLYDVVRRLMTRNGGETNC